MSTLQNAKAITDGILVSLDAANPESYQSGSILWYDTSGNGNHFYLYNSPEFDTTGSAQSVKFNGFSQYGYWIGAFNYSTNANYISGKFIGTNQNLITSPFNDRTIEIWFKSNGTSTFAVPYDWGGLFGDQANSNGLIYLDPGNKIRWRWDDSVAVWTQKTIQTGEWIQLVILLRNSYYYTYYVNGYLDTPELRSSDLGSPANFVWSIGRENRFGYYMACSVAILRMYNRTLSAQEILQNYNANRSRFGL